MDPNLISQLFALATVVLTDIALAGDNAVVVGMAAAGLPAELRRRAILIGIAGATLLRVAFAGVTLHLLQIVGLTLAGGILLLWVAWKLWRDLRRHPVARPGAAAGGTSFRHAVVRIIVADVSMSLDNVLAVAGAARGSTWVLAAGLVLSVALMGFAATLVARLLGRLPWLGHVGLLVIVGIALRMIWDGAHQVAGAS